MALFHNSINPLEHIGQLAIALFFSGLGQAFVAKVMPPIVQKRRAAEAEFVGFVG